MPTTPWHLTPKQLKFHEIIYLPNGTQTVDPRFHPLHSAFPGWLFYEPSIKGEFLEESIGHFRFEKPPAPKKKYNRHFEKGNSVFMPKHGEPSYWPRIFGDPSIPLYITEGPIKAIIAGEYSDRPFLGISGIDGLTEKGTKQVNREFAARCILKGRRVYLIPDGNVAKPSVAAGVFRATQALEGEGADVLILSLPFNEPEWKIDDWLHENPNVRSLPNFDLPEADRKTIKIFGPFLREYVQIKSSGGYATRPPPNKITAAETSPPALMRTQSITELEHWHRGEVVKLPGTADDAPAQNAFTAYSHYLGRNRALGFCLAPDLPPGEVVGNSLNIWGGYTAEPNRNPGALRKFCELWDTVFPATDYSVKDYEGKEHTWPSTSSLLIDILRAIDRGIRPQLQARALGRKGCGKTTAIRSLAWLYGYHYHEDNGETSRADARFNLEAVQAIIHFEDDAQVSFKDNGKRIQKTSAKTKRVEGKGKDAIYIDNPGMTFTSTNDMRGLKSDVNERRDWLLHGRDNQDKADAIILWATFLPEEDKLAVAGAVLYEIKNGDYLHGTVFVGNGPRTSYHSQVEAIAHPIHALLAANVGKAQLFTLKQFRKVAQDALLDELGERELTSMLRFEVDRAASALGFIRLPGYVNCQTPGASRANQEAVFCHTTANQFFKASAATITKELNDNPFPSTTETAPSPKLTRTRSR